MEKEKSVYLRGHIHDHWGLTNTEHSFSSWGKPRLGSRWPGTWPGKTDRQAHLYRRRAQIWAAGKPTLRSKTQADPVKRTGGRAQTCAPIAALAERSGRTPPNPARRGPRTRLDAEQRRIPPKRQSKAGGHAEQAHAGAAAAGEGLGGGGGGGGGRAAARIAFDSRRGCARQQLRWRRARSTPAARYSKKAEHPGAEVPDAAEEYSFVLCSHRLYYLITAFLSSTGGIGSNFKNHRHGGND